MKFGIATLVFAGIAAAAVYFFIAKLPHGRERTADDRTEQRQRGGDSRQESRAAQPATAQTGLVTEFHNGPDDAIDGLRLDNGTEVRFPASAADELAGIVGLDDRVTIEGWRYPGESEIHAATIKHESSGKVIAVDRPPPEVSQGDEQGRPEAPEDAGRAPGPPHREDRDRDRRPEGRPKGEGTQERPIAEIAAGRPANPAPPGATPVPRLHAESSPIAGFVRIPGGEFDVGDHHGFVDPKHGGDETPIHRVRLDAFDMGIFDVTTEQYCRFLNAAISKASIEVRQGGVYLAGRSELLCDTRQSSPSSPVTHDGKGFAVLDSKENHPMVCVRWHGAAAYCNWLSTEKGYPTCYSTANWDCDFNKSGFRLPTEAEWEYAARGGLQDPYFEHPWGSDADPTKANVPESRNPFRVGPRPTKPREGYQASSGPPGQAWRVGVKPLTTPVGFFNGKLQHKADWGWPGEEETFQTSDGANGYGLYDMAGNVWQWCTEWYDRDYYAYSPVENPPGPAQGSPMPDGKPYRCMRGGSWFNGPFGHSRVSNRDPSYYRGPDPVTGLSDAEGPWFHIGFRVVRPVDAEKRPVAKPTPVQHVVRRDGGPSGDPGSGRPPRPDRRPKGRPPENDVGNEQRPPRPDAERSIRDDLGASLRKPNGSFVLRSSEVTDGGTLPKEFTGDGRSATLPLEWTGAPVGTQSFAVVMHHIAPDMIKWYWVLYNIPADVMNLPKNVQGIGSLGNNSVNSELAYAPPHSKGPGEKKYTYTVYALSAPPKIGVPAAEVSRDVLLAAMKGLVLATAELNVVYTRGGGGESDENGPPPRRERMDGPEGEEARDRPDRPRNDEDRPRRPERHDDNEPPPREPRDRREQPRDARSERSSTLPPGGHTVGLMQNSPQAFQGYTLFAPKHHTMIYLMNNEGQAVHRWDSKYEPGQSVYLLENGHLLHCCFTKNRGFTSGGEGGRLEEFEWDGKLVWEFEYSSDKHLSHHDVKPLPNGNVLVLAVEKKTYEECLAAGFDPRMLRDRQLFPEFVIEVQPTRPKGGKILWEWHVWDHIVQENDRTKSNYGEVAKHPELIDVNCNGRPSPAFWNHGNSIAYNAKLDQIILSARGCNEIWIIDHGTTTEEAAGHIGGKRGKGGDLLYRWGNPAAYQRGSRSNRQLFQQHDAQWIPEGYPGAGHILIFNNGLDRGYSTIEEIVPPMDDRGNYVLASESAYGPAKPVWRYEANNREDFYSAEISGAHRLPNGNTLVCAGVIGTFFEVTPAGETVWQYVNPVVHNGILAQGELPGKDHRGHSWNAVFKIHRYEPDYPGLAGKELKPIAPIEQSASLCGKTGFHDQPSGEGPASKAGRDGGRTDDRPPPRGNRRGDDDPPPPPYDERRPPRADRTGGDDRPPPPEGSRPPRRPPPRDDERQPTRDQRD